MQRERILKEEKKNSTISKEIDDAATMISCGEEENAIKDEENRKLELQIQVMMESAAALAVTVTSHSQGKILPLYQVGWLIFTISIFAH